MKLCSVFQKRLSKSPVRKSAYLTLMKHKYSASVRITCKDWRANDFLPHTALKLGSCLLCITAASALAFEILASAFPTQLVLLEMSIGVHFTRIRWVVLSAHTALISVVVLWAFGCCCTGDVCILM